MRYKSFVEDLSPEDIGEYATSFHTSNENIFSLSNTFLLPNNNGIVNKVVLQEDILIESLYTDPAFYSSVEMEFCLLCDVMYAKTGTEVVAEPFYRVLENQTQEGPQSLKLLSD